ncbi:ArsR/SmtB family transcription factor [Amaricoccus macauensis]|uniref:ArsR/SmtB family transcription factor n=1 Tax=Amaricoccus macauensis TaxID=57001 RepID=UPI003C7D09A5
MDVSEESTLCFLRAVSNRHRLMILRWILDPRQHFPPQRDGDLEDDGVCVGFITEKLGVTQPTVTGHMQVLAEAGLVTSRKIKNWVFYKPRREAIREGLGGLRAALGPALDDAPLPGQPLEETPLDR